jgi:CDP-paratose 2-epimerase
VTNILITGCAGFIGSHLTEYFLKRGFKVIGIDNLSRNGTENNLQMLIGYSNFIFRKEDIRDFEKLKDIFITQGPFDLIIHEAAQVAVTTSVLEPRMDFEQNALGTFNMLEATRLYSPEAFFEFASTNKVYGKMADKAVEERTDRYVYADDNPGIDETCPLDFYSPYGCSKGAADQYVHDYSRIYDLQTVVLRQSCIYGTRQYGVEDQGWVAWFTIASILDKPITIYGDGRQVRDILWIDDLVEVYVRLHENREKIKGEVYNIGGGTENTLSLKELVTILKEEGVMKKDPGFAEWRPGDQKIFVCNLSKVKNDIGWKPSTSPKKGVRKLISWTVEHKEQLQSLLA